MPPEKTIFFQSPLKDYSGMPTQSSLADKIIGDKFLRRQVLNDQSEQDCLNIQQLSIFEIIRLLEVNYLEVEASIGRLNAAGKLEQVRRDLRKASIILDSQVEKLRKEQPELSNYQIGQILGKSLLAVEQSAHRLIAEGRIKPKKRGIPKKMS